MRSVEGIHSRLEVKKKVLDKTHFWKIITILAYAYILLNFAYLEDF